MKASKNSIIIIISSIILCMCSSVPKLQKDAPEGLKEGYYQKWNAGTKDGDSGIDLYIKLQDRAISLDSAYFRGQVAKLKMSQQDSTLFIGRFNLQKRVSNTSFISFKTNDDECVISYTQPKNKTIRYYKISNLIMRPTINYPSSRPKN